MIFINLLFSLTLPFLQEAENDEDYSGDYENSDTENSSNTSRLQQPIFLILASVLTFLQTLKY